VTFRKWIGGWKARGQHYPQARWCIGLLALGLAGRPLVWVVQSDGSKYCQPGSGVSLQEHEKKLRAGGVTVLESKKLKDHKRHAQVCGGSRGGLNGFQIPEDQVPQALQLGFVVWEGSEAASFKP
jgi:hypothetical protein